MLFAAQRSSGYTNPGKKYPLKSTFQKSLKINIFSPLRSMLGFPKMEVCQDYYGLPPPPVGFGQPLHLSKGDIVELTRADADLSWWEVMFKPTASVGLTIFNNLTIIVFHSSLK